MRTHEINPRYPDCSIIMERRLEQLTGSEAPSDGTSGCRVPLFHLFRIPPIYLSQACDTTSPACACNDGTAVSFFEWEEVFHDVFHYDGTVEQEISGH